MRTISHITFLVITFSVFTLSTNAQSPSIVENCDEITSAIVKKLGNEIILVDSLSLLNKIINENNFEPRLTDCAKNKKEAKSIHWYALLLMARKETGKGISLLEKNGNEGHTPSQLFLWGFYSSKNKSYAAYKNEAKVKYWWNKLEKGRNKALNKEYLGIESEEKLTEKSYFAARLLKEFSAIHNNKKTYLVCDYISDMAILLSNIKTPASSLMVYLEDLDPNNRLVAMFELVYFGRDSSLRSRMYYELKLLKESPNQYNYNKALDDLATIEAATGHLELARSKLVELKKNSLGAKALIYLSVQNAKSGRFEEAYADAEEALNLSLNQIEYEVLRQFYHLAEISGTKKNDKKLSELISKLPNQANKLIAFAYYARGAKNKEQLKQLLSSAKLLEGDGRNHALQEIAINAASLGEYQIGLDCVAEMRTKSMNQCRVVALSAIAGSSLEEIYLKQAVASMDYIPDKATSAIAEAIGAIAIAKSKLDKSFVNAIKIIENISIPNYRVKYLLQLAGVFPHRFYGE